MESLISMCLSLVAAKEGRHWRWLSPARVSALGWRNASIWEALASISAYSDQDLDHVCALSTVGAPRG
jgi:hypothetical protein